ncbi:STAS domain-containing protein [Streptomyces sp. NPDC054854]
MIPVPGPLRLTRTDTADTVRIELHGYFDHQDADALLTMVTTVLAEPGRPRDIRVDFTGMAAVDSSGLSVLLMARRRTNAAGARLYFDNRTPELERMLRITGTLDHFTRHHQDSRHQASSTGQSRPGLPDDPIAVGTGRPETTT